MKHASRQSWRPCDSQHLSFTRSLFVQLAPCLSRLRHPFIVRLKELLRNQLDGSLRLGRRHSAGFKPCQERCVEQEVKVMPCTCQGTTSLSTSTAIFAGSSGKRCGSEELVVAFIRYTQMGGRACRVACNGEGRTRPAWTKPLPPVWLGSFSQAHCIVHCSSKLGPCRPLPFW